MPTARRYTLPSFPPHQPIVPDANPENGVVRPFAQVAWMAQPNFRFEEFELNVDSCELRRSGVPVKVERIPMELLLLLLQNSRKTRPQRSHQREAVGRRGLHRSRARHQHGDQ